MLMIVIVQSSVSYASSANSSDSTNDILYIIVIVQPYSSLL